MIVGHQNTWPDSLTGSTELHASIHGEIVDAICRATTDVFATMMGVQVLPGEAHQEKDSDSSHKGVVALIGLAGNWVGTGLISCSPSFACKISSMMLMTEFNAIDNDVLDAIAEVANMVIGNVKTALEDHLGPMGLSIPTVVYGRNFHTRSVGQNQWTVVPFVWGNDLLEVKLCLAPSETTAALV